VARSGRGGPAENESLKLETEEQRQEPVEQNREAGQNPPRVVGARRRRRYDKLIGCSEIMELRNQGKGLYK
jgi:hypothetical protein